MFKEDSARGALSELKEIEGEDSLVEGLQRYIELEEEIKSKVSDYFEKEEKRKSLEYLW